MSVAIILSVYQKDKLAFFQESFLSIINQSFEDLKILIIADGILSEELDEYLNNIKDNRVKIYKLSQNHGLPFVLNFGIEKSLELGVRYIARMDADDIAKYNRIDEQVKCLEENLMVDIVGSSAMLIDSNNNIIGRKDVPKTVTFNSLRWKCGIIHPTVVFRSSFFSRFGYYNTNYLKSQDYELWFRAISKGAIVQNIEEPLLYFRYDSDLIYRRKFEQSYNIRIKKNYIHGFTFYLSILPNLFILLTPSIIIKISLKIIKWFKR